MFPDDLRWELIEAASLAVLRGQEPDVPFRSLGHVSVGTTSIIALASDHSTAGTHHLVEIDCTNHPAVTMVSSGSASGPVAPSVCRPLVEAEAAVGEPSYALVLVHSDVAWVRCSDGVEARRTGGDDIVLVASDGPSFLVEAIAEDGRRLGSLVVADDR